MNYLLPELNYAYDALEPYIDEKTMKIHHTKHHQNYLNNVLLELKDTTFLNLSPEVLITKLNDISDVKKRYFLRNNLGGYVNHNFFWKNLGLGTVLSGNLKTVIKQTFGSVSKFKNKFNQLALSVFGSGWTWLIINKDNQLSIISTSNQDNPMMGQEITSTVFGYPIIGLDLWEHAYYLKYKNNRIDYIKSFWNIVNWNEATLLFEKYFL